MCLLALRFGDAGTEIAELLRDLVLTAAELDTWGLGRFPTGELAGAERPVLLAGRLKSPLVAVRRDGNGIAAAV